MGVISKNMGENKKMVADAIKEISKEKQEEEIRKIKNIVKVILEKIDDKKKKEDEIRKERISLEKDLDDLKSGRLDRIEERQGKDPIHDKVTVIEIHKIIEEYIPYQPWRSPWAVEWKTQNTWGYVPATNQVKTVDCISNSTITGTAFQNFASGCYTINGINVNL